MTTQMTDAEMLIERLESACACEPDQGFEPCGACKDIAIVDRLRAEIAELRRDAEREINDADRFLVGLGLTVEECRTEGGALNVARIITKVSEIRVDKAIAERIDATIAAAYGEKT